MTSGPLQRALRVFVLTPSFPPTQGGQESHLLDLSAGLITAGASVQVLTRRETPGVPRSEYLGTVAVQRFAPFGPIKGVGLRAVPRLGLLMAKDVVPAAARSGTATMWCSCPASISCLWFRSSPGC